MALTNLEIECKDIVCDGGNELAIYVRRENRVCASCAARTRLADCT